MGVSKVDQPAIYISYFAHLPCIQHLQNVSNNDRQPSARCFIKNTDSISGKTLAQMRCVSKPWNTLLCQPSFIKSHLHRSIKTNDEILVIFANGFFTDSELFPITAHPCKSPHLAIHNFIQIPVNPNLSKRLSYDVHGSVNGLICLSYGRTDAEPVVQIWNPSISAILTLPPYGNPFGCTDKIYIQFGFGFDPKTDDYKVIKFMIPKPMLLRLIGFNVIDKNVNLPYENIQVEVYSLRKCSWESITERFPADVTRIDDKDQVCVDGHDGHLHWLGYVGDLCKQQFIVAFDLGDETFSKICLPFNNVDVDRRNELGILAGKLCVMSSVKDLDCEVWVMNEYGVVESWTKHHAFSQFWVRGSLFGFTLNNEFLFEPAGDNRLALYAPSEDKVKYFRYPGRLYSVVKVVVYVDSLVWIAPSGCGSTLN